MSARVYMYKTFIINNIVNQFQTLPLTVRFLALIQKEKLKATKKKRKKTT